MLAHADNLAERTCEGVDRYLEFNTLSTREMYLLIKASQEGPTLSKALSVKLRVTIVKYFARSEKPTRVNMLASLHVDLSYKCLRVCVLTCMNVNMCSNLHVLTC